MTQRNPVLENIQSELRRVKAHGVAVRWDEQFDPDSGPLVEVALGDAYWHLLPEQLSALLEELDDSAGEHAVQHAIEQRGTFVWHGPSPPGSRDTGP